MLLVLQWFQVQNTDFCRGMKTLTHDDDLHLYGDGGMSLSINNVHSEVLPAQRNTLIYHPAIVQPPHKGGGISFHWTFTLQTFPFQ